MPRVSSELLGSIRAWLSALEAECPGVQLPEQAVLQHVQHLHGEKRAETLIPDGLHGKELCLALAAAQGDARAVRELSRWLDEEIVAAFARVRAPEAVLQDAAQHVRAHVLVGKEGKPPALLAYAGSGSLRGWLRVTALRHCMNMVQREQRGEARKASSQSLAEIVDVGQYDPELVHLAERYRTELREAFESALETLDVQQRNMLRQAYLDELSPEELGALYGVHRTTAFRWLQKAEAQLIKRVRSELSRRGVSARELESVVRLVGSQLHISVRRYLAG